MLLHNRTYRKSVRHFNDVYWLDIEAWLNLGASEHFIFSIEMIHLLAGEKTLDSGRFSLFSDEMQDHAVNINFKNEWVSYKSIFTERLDWISQNATGEWGFDVNIPHLSVDSENTLSFSFKNRTDAMMFKLSF